MKNRWITPLIAVFLFLILIAPAAQADNELTGPAYKINFDDGSCSVTGVDYAYSGKQRILYSNSNTGHAQFKCKLALSDGDPQISYSEFFDSFPLGGEGCFNTISLEGETGMWIAQCSGVWNYGD